MSLTQELESQLQGAPVQQIAAQLGIDPAQATQAVSMALPLLVGALGHNASQPQGAQALHMALQDHAGGDVGSVLGSVLGGAMGGAGGSGNDTLGRMLGHIFGNREPQATQGLGQATGLGSPQVQMLLRILAPIVLAYLANHMFRKGATQAPVASTAGDNGVPENGQSSPDVLGDVLGQERARIGREHPDGLLGQVFGKVLDRDGDGNVGLGDILKAGGDVLGGRRNA